MERDTVKENARQLMLLSMQLFHLVYRDKMGPDNGKAAMMALAGAFDGLLNELEQAPVHPLPGEISKKRSENFSKILSEMNAILRDMKSNAVPF